MPKKSQINDYSDPYVDTKMIWNSVASKLDVHCSVHRIVATWTIAHKFFMSNIQILGGWLWGQPSARQTWDPTLEVCTEWVHSK